MSIDGRPPVGIPLFWPFSQEYFIFPYPILPSIMHSELDHPTIGQFLDGFFPIHNLYAMFLEFAIMIPCFMIVWFFNLRYKKNKKRNKLSQIKKARVRLFKRRAPMFLLRMSYAFHSHFWHIAFPSTVAAVVLKHNAAKCAQVCG